MRYKQHPILLCLLQNWDAGFGGGFRRQSAQLLLRCVTTSVALEKSINRMNTRKGGDRDSQTSRSRV
jgi:hypothetical protein